MLQRTLWFLVFGLVCVRSAWSETITLPSQFDATLFENSGARSSGAGGVIFTGTNLSESPRRGLLRFDLAGVVPANATIDSVQLTLTVASFAGSGGGNIPFGHDTSLHALVRDWGEGTAGAGSGASGSGQGFPTASDGTSATWTHAFLETEPWSVPGGDFAATPSATAFVTGTVDAPFVWGSTPTLVADVQNWLDNPAMNFGWAVLGDETEAQTVRSFYSREESLESLRPALSITYTPVPEPSTLTLLSVVAAACFVWRRSRR
jgi:hypothetical protein